MPTLHGTYEVAHFDGKSEANHYFTDLGVPTAFLRTSAYESCLRRNIAVGRLSVRCKRGRVDLGPVAWAWGRRRNGRGEATGWTASVLI